MPRGRVKINELINTNISLQKQSPITAMTCAASFLSFHLHLPKMANTNLPYYLGSKEKIQKIPKERVIVLKENQPAIIFQQQHKRKCRFH